MRQLHAAKVDISQHEEVPLRYYVCVVGGGNERNAPKEQSHCRKMLQVSDDSPGAVKRPHGSDDLKSSADATVHTRANSLHALSADDSDTRA